MKCFIIAFSKTPKRNWITKENKREFVENQTLLNVLLKKLDIITHILYTSSVTIQK